MASLLTLMNYKCSHKITIILIEYESFEPIGLFSVEVLINVCSKPVCFYRRTVRDWRRVF